VFMLTLIGEEWQRSPATVRQLEWCLSTVRATFGEASAPRMYAKASSSSLLALNGGGKLKFGGYVGFGGFLTCGQKFAQYAALYIRVFT
jgi:hypothetical protein